MDACPQASGAATRGDGFVQRSGRMTTAVVPFTKPAHAKVNLRLEVGPKAGVLHPVISVVAELALADVVRFEQSAARFSIDCDLPGLEPTDNVAWKAAQALGVDLPSIRVDIEKRIPSQAGLGGGSSDAAAVLQGLAEIASTRGEALPPDLVAAAALRAGSDVPSFFIHGLRIVSGVGDVVAPFSSSPPAWGVVLLRPATGSSTTKAYALLDSAGIAHQLGTHAERAAEETCIAFAAGDLERTAALLHNDFEAVIEAELPEVRRARERLRRVGARATVLCGSGSCVASFFGDEVQAHEAAARLLLDAGEWMHVTVFSDG